VKKKRSLFRKILLSRLWWLVFGVIAVVAAWQGWSSVAHTVITHEIMGRMNDSQEVRVIYVGDTGTGDDNQKKVAEQMEELCKSTDPAAVVLLGDNFYQIGVSSVEDPMWDSRFEKMYSGDCLRKLTFYAVLGNHDYKGDADAQIAYTRAKGGRWTMPARFYSLKFGELLEIGAADTTISDRCGIPSLCSVDWLVEKLKASTARWKILVGHHPILSGGKYRALRGLAHFNLPELYCQSGASIYISGHDHGLQHLHGRYPTSKCEIEQFVSGGGGASLYPVEDFAQQTLYAESVHGVLVGRYTIHEQRYEFFRAGTTDPAYSWSQKYGK
jgi:acid phosphatase